VTPFAAAAATALIAATWQGFLLAACVALLLRLLPGISAAVRSTIWLAVFAIVLALHFIPAHSAPASAAHPLHLAPTWSLIVAAIWLTLSLIRALQFAVSAIRLRQILRRATPLPESFCAPFIASLPHAMSGFTTGSESTRARSYVLCTSPDVDRPSVLGFFHPRILLPAGLVDKLTPAELEQVLLHETEHLRRSDDWTNLLQKLALVVFPLNPVLYWIERRLCLERELACDDRVLQSSGQPRKAYALCLTQLAEHSILRRGMSLALAAVGNWNQQSQLSQRIHRILRRPEPTLTRRQSTFATATLLLGVLAGSITLARAPRLVSFASAAQPVLAVAAADPINPGVASETWAAKPLLTKAIMPPAQVPQRAIIRRRPTAKRLPDVNAPGIYNTAARVRASQPRVILTLASGQQVQHFYVPTIAYVAAFRTPDGWIIFQL
jgi:beta-lactamase regulating signal transducer with metallopeptidase domain